MSTPPSRPSVSGKRMPSTVRVRRHHNSRLFHFLQRQFDPHNSEHNPIPEIQRQDDTKGGDAAAPAVGARNSSLPGGRTVDGGIQRPVPDRRKSAVEQLVDEDRRTAAYGGSSFLGVDGKSSDLDRSRIPISRATVGHAPQLASVLEDESAIADVMPAIQLSESVTQANTSAASQSASDPVEDYFLPTSPAEGGIQSGQKPPLSPRSHIPGDAPDNSSRLDNVGSEGATISADSGQIRFLIPFLNRKRSGTIPPPSDTKESGSSTSPVLSSGDNRIRRKSSNVSIPTPVREEEFDEENHVDDVADYLDVVDPEVGALGYLSNIGNSIFVPNIPALYDRRPTHDLPGSRRRGLSVSSMLSGRRASVSSTRSRHSQGSSAVLEEGRAVPSAPGFAGGVKPVRTASRSMLNRVTSAVGWSKKEDEGEFTQHIKRWREMDEEERDELDEHVRMLLTKKSKFKRGAKGFYAFVKTPMGFIMTLYGFLVTFWGTAIVLFIFGWIHVGERKRYWIEICDQILCALFAAVGLGFAPFRAVDTYRMIHIAHYHHLTWKRRKELGLTELKDPNDLPRPTEDGSNQVSRVEEITDPNTDDGNRNAFVTESKHSLLTESSASSEKLQKSARRHRHHKQVVLPLQSKEKAAQAAAEAEGRIGDLSKGRNGALQPPLKRNESIQSELVKEKEDIVVLTKGEQAVLEHHQRKFHSSHTFYRFHETATHRAFPLDLMIVIVCLLDCHSLLQAALGGCTWGIKYTHRPTVLTATLISCSLSCNAVAGLIIYLGGRRTKKREEVERRLRIALEAEALAKIERRRARGELPMRDHDDPVGDSPSPDGNEQSATPAAQERELFDANRDRIVKETFGEGLKPET